MPFALIFIGALMIVTGLKGTYQELSDQLAKDFTGAGNYFYWIASILIVGFVGYISPFKSASRAFLALIVLSIILANRSSIGNWNAEISQGSTTGQSEDTSLVAPLPTNASSGDGAAVPVPVAVEANAGGVDGASAYQNIFDFGSTYQPLQDIVEA